MMIAKPKRRIGFLHFCLRKRLLIASLHWLTYSPSVANLGNNSCYFTVSGKPKRMLVLVGLMGAGKTSAGRRLAHRLDVPFLDADDEIARAAGRTIADIFADFGETGFRDGERKVIARLLDGPPGVLATGGGAWMDAQTRALVQDKGLSIWLHADLDILMERVLRRNTRPLLKQRSPRKTMQELVKVRYPVYASADIHINSGDGSHEKTLAKIMAALADFGLGAIKRP